MNTVLSIQVQYHTLYDRKEIDFFGSTIWNPESESQFIFKVRELFSIIRGHCSGVDLRFNLNTDDISYLTFALNKKKRPALDLKQVKLSKREHEVLTFIMLGLTNTEIAEKLFLGFETIKSHRKNILAKTGARNTASLISYYHQTFFDK